MTAPWHGCSPADFPTKSGGSVDVVTQQATARSAVGTYFNGNLSAYVQSPQQTARTSGGSGATRMQQAIGSGNTHISWLNSSGIEVVRVQLTGSQIYQLQFWNGSTWTNVGSAVTFANAVVRRWLLDFSGLGTSSGSLRLVVIKESDSTVEMDASGTGLNLTSATNIDRVRHYSPNFGNGAYGVTEAFLKDGTAVSAYVHNITVNANGTYTDGTGTYTAVDDTNTGALDTDFISLASSGQRQSVKGPARNFGGRSCKSVGFALRGACGASGPTQIKAFLYIGGTRYYWGGGSGTAVTMATTYGDYWFGWELDPSTGAAWGTNAESANLEFGWEVV